MELDLHIYATVALALIFYYIGSKIKARVKFLRTFCIPTPVVGGMIFSILNLILHQTGILSLSMDGIFQELCMVVFFTSIGYSAALKTILKAGKQVVILSGITAVLICLQNLIGGYVINIFGVPKLIGLTLGSVALVGGHGNAGAFGPEIQNMGFEGAASVALAGATFGLVFGSILGGPVADFLIRQHHLEPATGKKEALAVTEEGEGSNDLMNITESKFISNTMLAMFHIFISMAVGYWANGFIKDMTGITIPVFLCSMIVACVIRNISDYTGVFPVCEYEGNIVGTLGLNIFLALAMMSVKLWQLIDLAVPMAATLLVEVVVTVAFIVLVTFKLMGKDYEAAVMCAAQVGYGFGATPNAMANIAAVEEKYTLAPQARLVIPFVGGLFTSLMNAALITAFIGFFS